MSNKYIVVLIFGIAIFTFACSLFDDGDKGIYHEGDKEGLRLFLKQPTGTTGIKR